jgi:hypothetical protein
MPSVTRPYSRTTRSRLGTLARGTAAIVLVAVAASALPARARAQKTQADADMEALKNYRLTEAAMAKYIKASQNLVTLVKSKPEWAKNIEKSQNDNASFADIAAFYDKIPPVRQALSSAGMSSREFVLFTFSMFQAGMGAWAMSQPGGKLPEGTPAENVAFYKKHEAQLKKLGEEMQAASKESSNKGDETDEDQSAESDSTEPPLR